MEFVGIDHDATTTPPLSTSAEDALAKLLGYGTSC
jgi:hypothetical protein